MSGPDPELVATIQARADELRLELLLVGHARIPITGAEGAHVLVVLTQRGDLLVTIEPPAEAVTPPA